MPIQVKTGGSPALGFSYMTTVGRVLQNLGLGMQLLEWRNLRRKSVQFLRCQALPKMFRALTNV